MQLYSRVVLKKSIKQPYPIYTVEKLWEKINNISTGIESKPNTNKLFVGLKNVTVVGLSNFIRYKGCPKCLKGVKKIGASYCSAHGTDVVQLEDLQWNEWLVYGDEDEFIVKMSPSYMKDYNEINMTGAVIWVEGVIDLDTDPIMMMTNRVLQFKPGKLMLGNLDDDDDGDGDDFTAGREEVDLDGFDDKTSDNEFTEKNPFKVDDVPLITKDVPDNGIISEFKMLLRSEFKDILGKVAMKDPVAKVQIERYMLGWIEDEYPREFTDEDEAKKKFWAIVEGLYLITEDGRIRAVVE